MGETPSVGPGTPRLLELEEEDVVSATSRSTSLLAA